MKKKLFMLLAVVMTVMTASADVIPTYELTVGTTEHGTLSFKVDNAAATSAAAEKTVTVTVAPATGYATKEVTAVAYAKADEAKAPRRADINLLQEITVSGSGNTWTFTMPAAHALVSATYTRIIQSSWIQPENIDDQTYTGEGLEPAITVKDGETVLTEDVDYTVTYSNNVQGGGKATVTVTGIGNYSGTVSKTFNVVAAVYSTANAAIDVNVPERLGQMTPATAGQTTDLYYFLQSYLQNSPNPAYIKLRLEAGAQYVISKPLTVLSAITIEGDAKDPATIDATALGANPFIKIDNNYTSGLVNEKGFCTNMYDVTFKNFTLKGLKGQFFYANKQKYLIPYFTVDNCVIRMEGAKKKTFFDFNGGGFVENFTLTNSTLSGNDATTWQNGGFFSTQSGSKRDEAGASVFKQTIKNNTFYNVAAEKTLSTLKENDATWMSFEVKNNVVVKSGKKGQFVKGLCAGFDKTKPSWLVQYNSFQWIKNDGTYEDIGATEISGAPNCAIAANVEGEIVFANGAEGIAEGDFSLDACPQKEAQIGDPRWLSASLLSKRITTESLDDDKDLAKAINQGVKDGFSRFTLEANARYSVKQSIVSDKNLVIIANNVKIDVEHADAFIVLDGTTELAKKADGTDSDHKLIGNVRISGLTIQGLQGALLKDNQKTLAEEVEIDNCVIEMPAGGKNVLDFNGKGYAGKAIVKNSTIWCAGKNTGFFAQYGSRPKNVNGDWLQEFDIENSTIINIANGKNFCDLKQNGTAQNVYVIKNSIFNSCGKNGQTVVGFNKGQASATPAWDVTGNSFLLDGEDNNAAEISKAGQKDGEDIVKNCVEGAPGFKKPAEGDFTLSAYSAQCAAKTGDPRWYAEGGHYNATAIEDVKAEKADDGAWYTLQGIRIDKPAKGLYIHNGKKVVVK